MAAPEAVVHHHSMASTDLLGLYERGMLFERNAYLTAARNFDHELWPLLQPAVLWTLLARTETLLAEQQPPWRAAARSTPTRGAIADTAGGRGATPSAAPGAPPRRGSCGRRCSATARWRRRAGPCASSAGGSPAATAPRRRRIDDPARWRSCARSPGCCATRMRRPPNARASRRCAGAATARSSSAFRSTWCRLPGRRAAVRLAGLSRAAATRCAAGRGDPPRGHGVGLSRALGRSPGSAAQRASGSSSSTTAVP